MTIERYYKKLEVPQGRVDVLLDTDAYNEVDDQYAIAYLLRCGEKLNVKAITAAPFSNIKVSSPKEGMELSYNEILNILSLAEYASVKLRGNGTCVCPINQASTGMLSNSERFIRKYWPSLSMVSPSTAP